MANVKKIKFRLSQRQAVWDPNIEGFEGLSAITIPQRLEGEVTSEDTRLFAAVERGLQYGTLVLNDRKAKKEVESDPEDEAVKAKPKNMDTHVQNIMSTMNQAELGALIKQETDPNLLQIIMEYELKGQNKSGNVRRTLVEQLKKRIQVVDQPTII